MGSVGKKFLINSIFDRDFRAMAWQSCLEADLNFCCGDLETTPGAMNPAKVKGVKPGAAGLNSGGDRETNSSRSQKGKNGRPFPTKRQLDLAHLDARGHFQGISQGVSGVVSRQQHLAGLAPGDRSGSINGDRPKIALALLGFTEGPL